MKFEENLHFLVYTGKKGHPPFRGWRRPDVKRTKCNQIGHEAITCENKNQQRSDRKRLLNKKKRRVTCSLRHVSLTSNQVRID